MRESVCVCLRERERKREKERERAREGEGMIKICYVMYMRDTERGNDKYMLSIHNLT